jgi:hypothetical protein
MAETPAQVLAALDLPDDQARAIGQAARQRVLAAHTGRARARELAQALAPRALAATGT